MSQAEASKLVSKLRYNLKPRRKLKNPEGPLGRHNKIRKIVTALFKHERIELNYFAADEARGYAERLISEAVRHGDCHKETMEMASYWVLEKPIVHKLFKVLAPRYQNFQVAYTKMWKAPIPYYSLASQKCVLELKNNIYPPLGPDKTYHKNLIHNVLLNEAKKMYNKEKILKETEESADKANKAKASSQINDDKESSDSCDNNESVDTLLIDKLKLSEKETNDKV